MGSALLRLLPEIGEVVATDRHKLALLNPDSIWRAVRVIRLELIIRAKTVQQEIHFSRVSGIYHLTAAGETTWYEFACAILEEEATRGRPLITRRIIPITTAEYPTPASRPIFSVLSNSHLLTPTSFKRLVSDCLTHVGVAGRRDRCGGWSIRWPYSHRHEGHVLPCRRGWLRAIRRSTGQAFGSAP